MRKLLCILLTISHIYAICGYAMIQPKEVIEIYEVPGKYFSIELGSADGIEVGQYYEVSRKDPFSGWGDVEIIGTAKVVKVKEHVAALESVDIKKSFQPGDRLKRVSSILFEVRQKEFSKKDIGEEPSYTLRGQKIAEMEYSGSGALVGGIFAGLLLGVIGWLIGWAIVSNSQVDVPLEHLTRLNENQRFEFSDAYKQTVKKIKVSKFHTGAAVGLLAWILILVSVSSGD